MCEWDAEHSVNNCLAAEGGGAGVAAGSVRLKVLAKRWDHRLLFLCLCCAMVSAEGND